MTRSIFRLHKSIHKNTEISISREKNWNLVKKEKKKRKIRFTKLQRYTNQTDVQNVVRLCERNLKMRIERTTDEREDYINRGLTSRKEEKSARTFPSYFTQGAGAPI